MLVTMYLLNVLMLVLVLLLLEVLIINIECSLKKSVVLFVWGLGCVVAR